MKFISDEPEPTSFIYLLSPYSDESIITSTTRYILARAAVAMIVQEGFPVYSPILHNHDMAMTHGVDGTSDFWNVLNRPFLDACSDAWVLMIEGWEQSRGIQWEVEYLKARDKNVRYVYFPEGHSQLLMLDD